VQSVRRVITMASAQQFEACLAMHVLLREVDRKQLWERDKFGWSNWQEAISDTDVLLPVS